MTTTTYTCICTTNISILAKPHFLLFFLLNACFWAPRRARASAFAHWTLRQQPGHFFGAGPCSMDTVCRRRGQVCEDPQAGLFLRALCGPKNHIQPGHLHVGCGGRRQHARLFGAHAKGPCTAPTLDFFTAKKSNLFRATIELDDSGWRNYKGTRKRAALCFFLPC
ncbi:hypothetical protein TW95_gp0025 [Pandoravirus inopinatum]|uniref:Uncharacterized protein n=1 Tax=Pandoravirus inopinatum TaxID=1605721 RepID=A0A0B5J007_9VIRU|nr:hypothetical protein TW95_gp0025 [Pandoravirus inopinatum]AJF96759.1 hypothetical protein [Pandoravirus inopinatum]